MYVEKNNDATLGSERIAELEAENERLRKAGYEIGYHDAMKAAKRGGTLTAEQVSKAVYAHSIHADCTDADWQAIADELNGELGSERISELEFELSSERISELEAGNERKTLLMFTTEANEPVSQGLDLLYGVFRYMSERMTEAQYIDFIRCVKAILDEQ